MLCYIGWLRIQALGAPLHVVVCKQVARRAVQQQVVSLSFSASCLLIIG